MPITRIQSSADTSGAAPSGVNVWTAVWGAPPAVGNFVTLGVVSLIDDINPIVPGVIVSQGGVIWTFVSRETSATGGAQFGVVLDTYFGIANGPVVLTDIAISYIGTTTVGCAVYAEYSGMNNDAPLDVFFNQNGAATPIPCGPTAFTSQRDELWAAFWCSENTQNEPTAASNSFALVETINLSQALGLPDISGEPSMGYGELIATDRGNPSSDATTTAADREASIMVAFKAGGPSGFPSAPTPETTSSITPNTDYVGQGLDRLAEQFKSGD